MDSQTGCCEEIAPMPKQLVKPDLKEGLINRQTRLKQQLAEVDAAITALEEHPEVAKVLELVGRASRY
jgi:chaperonin cofactor prefoldin